MSAIPLLCLIPVVGGTVYAIVSVVIVLRYFEQANSNPEKRADFSPAVTILKPVCGLEKELKANLRSACLQSYPEYEVIFSVQDPRDPALSILHEIRQEFGCRRVSVVVSDVQAGSNGKVNNLLGALSKASHDVLVISDSDTRLRPDYLSNIVAPLADPEVACACTLFKVTQADRLVEKLEALTINTDFMPSEGGIVTTNDTEEDYLLRSLRNQGKRGRDYGGLHHDFGNSSRLPEITALLGRLQLRRLPHILQKRQTAYATITARLADAGVAYVSTDHMDTASHYKLIVRVAGGLRVEDVKRALLDDGIVPGGAVYEIPCHRQPVFSGVEDGGSWPIAEHWCPRHICPPLTSGMSEEDARRVGESLARNLEIREARTGVTWRTRPL